MRHAASTARRLDLGPLDSGADSAETPLTAEAGNDLRTAECSSALHREPSTSQLFPLHCTAVQPKRHGICRAVA